MTERAHTTRRIVLVFVGLVAALVALLAANLLLGSVAVAPADLLSDRIVWDIRLPRMFMAAILGGALALSGVLLQAFFNNPLAGPFVLGISSGAKLVVAAVMVFVVGASGVLSSWMLILAAFVGSGAVMLLMLVVSVRIRSSSALVLAGVMLGYLCGAATDLIVSFAGDTSIVSLRNWSMGSFAGSNWDDLATVAVAVLISSACVFLMSKPLAAYQLGEGYAQSVGVNVRAFRVVIIVLSSLLAACVVAFAGPISFVGVAVPHIVKRLLGTSRPIVVIPGALLGGSVFCLLSDLIARTAFVPNEVSVSTITALLGAPVVVWVLMHKQGRAEA